MAAVLTLGAMLTFLVYSIVAPVTPETANLADSDLSSTLSEQVPMRGKLELVCSTLPTVDSFLMRSVQFNELGSFIQKEEENGELIYHVSCRRDQIKPLLSDLSSVWHQFEETAFFVNTGELGQSVQIDRVSVGQVASLIDEQDSLKRIEYAKLEAVRNSMQGQPNSEPFLAKDDSNGFPPMPMLTSGEPNKSESTDANDPRNRVELTIVLKQKTP